MATRVFKAAAGEVGGCNYCASRDGVYVVRGVTSVTLEVRFCDECLRDTLHGARMAGFRTRARR